MVLCGWWGCDWSGIDITSRLPSSSTTLEQDIPQFCSPTPLHIPTSRLSAWTSDLIAFDILWCHTYCQHDRLTEGTDTRRGRYDGGAADNGCLSRPHTPPKGCFEGAGNGRRDACSEKYATFSSATTRTLHPRLGCFHRNVRSLLSGQH